MLMKPAAVMDRVSPWQNTMFVGSAKLVDSETAISVSTLTGRSSRVGKGLSVEVGVDKSSGTGLARTKACLAARSEAMYGSVRAILFPLLQPRKYFCFYGLE